MIKRKFAVIGHPIGHTMSPFIHNRLFEIKGVNAVYTALDIDPEKLSDAFRGELSEFEGFNVTIPHKQAIIPNLSELDPKAEMYGSVNTVHNTENGSKGYTTDPDGFLKALEYAGIPLDGRVVILGCGGVARTFAFEALLRGAKLEFSVLEKDRENTTKLIAELNSKLDSPQVSFCTLDALDGEINTLINATPVGMSPKVDAQPVPDSVIAKAANVFDAVYNPLETVLIKKAKANGSRAEGGMSMLVWQAEVAQRHWGLGGCDSGEVEKLCADAARELESR